MAGDRDRSRSPRIAQEADFSDGSDGEDGPRMASVEEGGFTLVDSAVSANKALEEGNDRLEFFNLESSDIDACVDMVCAVLAQSVTKPRLTGFSFVASSLSAAQLRKLAVGLRGEPGQNIGALGICKNPGVEAAAWQELFNRIPSNAEWLDFGDNQLTDEQVAPLFACLKDRETLDKLYLDGNKLQDISGLCLALPDTGVTQLDLGDNSIKDIGIMNLTRVLHQTVVNNLVLGSNPMSASVIQALIQALPRSGLDTLYLDNTDFDDMCLHTLGGVLRESRLTELHIDNTKISDTGVISLIPHVTSSRLNYMDVGGNSVSERTTQMLDTAANPDRGDWIEAGQDWTPVCQPCDGDGTEAARASMD